MLNVTWANGVTTSCGAATFPRAMNDNTLTKLETQKRNADQCDQHSLDQQETV